LKSRKWEEQKFFTAFSMFKSGVTFAEEAEYAGQLSKSQTDQNVNKVRELIFRNRIITLHDISNMLRISSGSVQSILRDKKPESGIWGIGISTITTHLLALHEFLALK
jgi:hypothetical protein